MSIIWFKPLECGLQIGVEKNSALYKEIFPPPPKKGKRGGNRGVRKEGLSLEQRKNRVEAIKKAYENNMNPFICSLEEIFENGCHSELDLDKLGVSEKDVGPSQNVTNCLSYDRESKYAILFRGQMRARRVNLESDSQIVWEWLF